MSVQIKVIPVYENDNKEVLVNALWFFNCFSIIFEFQLKLFNEFNFTLFSCKKGL